METSVAIHNTPHIGNIIRHAMVFNFPKSQEATMHTDALLQTVARLFTLLHERQIVLQILRFIFGFNYQRLQGGHVRPGHRTSERSSRGVG